MKIPRLQLNALEREIITLKSAVSAIDTALNHEVLTLRHNDPNSEIHFKSYTQRQFFGIILLDFLNSKLIEVEASCLDALRSICAAPLLAPDSKALQGPVDAFKSWLDQDVEFEHDGEVRKLWFPTIDRELALKISRISFIRICGNISKHNALSLSYQATVIQEIFDRNGSTIDFTQALLIMKEFYEQFHDDIFVYHCSAIAEFLNNIRWGIHEYLRPEYSRCREDYWDDRLKMMAYKFKPPVSAAGDFAKSVHWDLLNDVRSGPIMPKFVVTKWLKLRY